MHPGDDQVRVLLTTGAGTTPRALFVVVRQHQQSDLAEQLGCEIVDGAVSVDGGGRTTVPGVYAVGTHSCAGPLRDRSRRPRKYNSRSAARRPAGTGAIDGQRVGGALASARGQVVGVGPSPVQFVQLEEAPRGEVGNGAHGGPVGPAVGRDFRGIGRGVAGPPDAVDRAQFVLDHAGRHLGAVAELGQHQLDRVRDDPEFVREPPSYRVRHRLAREVGAHSNCWSTPPARSACPPPVGSATPARPRRPRNWRTPDVTGSPRDERSPSPRSRSPGHPRPPVQPAPSHPGA